MSTPVTPQTPKGAAFFERQFRDQVEAGDYALNPFERAFLPLLWGDVLDLGCGLGNLALAAAQAGCRITALDASASATADLTRRARAAGLALEAHPADLRHYVPAREYHGVVSVGLLMFLDAVSARALLARMKAAVCPGGIAAINVLVEGTTYMGMFDPAAWCLFGEDELSGAFEGWEVLHSEHAQFDAPGGTVKRFHTLAARRPL